MPAAPVFQFCPKDFLLETRVLGWSLEAVGAYSTLFSIYWLQGYLPADLTSLARHLNVSRKRMERLWTVIGPRFEAHNGQLRHPNLEAVREQQARWRERAASGGRAKALKHERNHALSNHVFDQQALGEQPPSHVSRAPDDCTPSPSSSASQSSTSSALVIQQNRDRDERVTPGERTPKRVLWLRELIEAYPAHARTMGRLTERAFAAVFANDPREPRIVFSDLLARLENHKRGPQWRVKGMVPKLEKWLREGLYAQWHDEMPATAPMNDKTPKTLTAAEALVKKSETVTT